MGNFPIQTITSSIQNVKLLRLTESDTDPMFLLGYFQCGSKIKDEACVKKMRIQCYNHKELVYPQTWTLNKNDIPN